MIEKYEMRPADLENLCLSYFEAWYTEEQKRKRKRDASEFDVGASENDEENLEDEDEEDDANSNNGQIIQEKRSCTSLEIQKL
ncbi:hypothetical protein AVEN_75070-1 [Araneus ventricosus]|uniref:Uncharacterized protein n=1 Tax=Araneus ventricosus TaxID=182803 RepID=A0A4Y2S055_ARAVE|nr:hypothetical protein AVEN_75070-1 [Araneus ventricosus]